MKKLFPLLLTSAVMLSACLDNGSPAAPPTNMNAAVGDGKIKVIWTTASAVEYWLFTATDAALTAFNWVSLPNAHVYTRAPTPFYFCGALNQTAYYFAANGRINGGPGGASSTTVSGTPLLSGNHWVSTSSVSDNFFGVGYAGLTTCSNNASSAAGSFAAVGAAGAIYTSQAIDGLPGTIPNWSAHSVTGGFAHNLYAVTGYAASQNNPAAPNLRWVAVGDGGASVISTDAGSTTWSVGNAYDPAKPALRSIIHVGATFWAVGDTPAVGGQPIIQSSSDGVTWTAHSNSATNHLNGITYGNGLFVAVGNNGTIVTSSDGNIWTVRTSSTSEHLRHVSAMMGTFVAVGDNGAIVTSTDQGITWTKQTTSLGTPNFVGIASNIQMAGLNATGTAFTRTTPGISANAQFVAIDSSGNYYTSPDGLTWNGTVKSTGVGNLNTLVSSGFGYLAGGNSGAILSAF